MSEIKQNDTVRVLRVEDENHPNAYARVVTIYEDGRVWVTNLNMPYMGTISEIVKDYQIQKVEK